MPQCCPITAVMELECYKYNEKMQAGDAVCRHPNDYCKYRASCMIQFLSSENRAKKMAAEKNNDPLKTSRQRKMIVPNFAKSESGLLPAIAQDADTGEVLMLAYINREAWEKTLATGKAHYWSRSRNKLWLKGETSGHVQLIKEIRIDCDEDTVVFKVEQLGGAACHEGYSSCFFRRVDGDSLTVVGERLFDPDKVYKK